LDIIEQKLDSIGCVVVYLDNGDNPMCLCSDSVLNNPPRWFDQAIKAGGFDTGSFRGWGTCDNCGALIALSAKDHVKRSTGELLCPECLTFIGLVGSLCQPLAKEILTETGIPFIFIGQELFCDCLTDEKAALQEIKTLWL